MINPVIAAAAAAAVSGTTMFVVGKNTSQEKVAQQTSQSVSRLEAAPTPNVQAMPITKKPIQSITRQLILNPYCNIIYSTLHKAPLAVHQNLTLDVITGPFKRQTHWRKDPSIEPQMFAVGPEYYSGVYESLHTNRGHMAASSNYKSSRQNMNSTFKLSNIIPQDNDNNQKTWKVFQEYSLSLLTKKKCDSVEIVSGPIFDSQMKNPEYTKADIYLKTQTMIKENGIIVPRHLYKIIKCNTKSGSYASAFKFKNYQSPENQLQKQEDTPFKDFKINFEELENRTGLLFNLKDQIKGDLAIIDPQTMNRSLKNNRSIIFTQIMKDPTRNDLNDFQGISCLGKNCDANDIAPHIDKIDKKAKEELERIRTNKYECGSLLESLHMAKEYSSLTNKFPGLIGSMNNEISTQIKKRIPLCLKEQASDQDNKRKMRISQIKQEIKGLLMEKDARKYPQYQQLFKNFAI